jgi:hypothetical protein
MFSKAADVTLPSQVKNPRLSSHGPILSAPSASSCPASHSIPSPSWLRPRNSSSLQQEGYAIAKVSSEEAYELRWGYLSEDDNFTMGSLSLLATALKAQDKYEETEAIHRQALGSRAG